jgi:hypothetical protein
MTVIGNYMMFNLFVLFFPFFFRDWAVLYFILMTVIGNYMMFNLFVAIIITGFSENKAAILKEEKVLLN